MVKMIGAKEDREMKKIIIAMAAFAAAFTMASCNKELVEPENNPTEGNCIITASTESTLTKTSLEGDDTEGYEVVWSEGDSFKIGDNIFTLTAGEGTTNGTFEGTAPLDGTYDVYYKVVGDENHEDYLPTDPVPAALRRMRTSTPS